MISPPEALEPLGSAALERSSLSLDGRTLAVIDPEHGDAHVFDLHNGVHRIMAGQHPGAAFVAISPEGNWVAAGAWKGKGVKVWDARSGELCRELPTRETANVAFSPNGRWLVTGSSDEYCCYAVGSWQPQYRIHRDRCVRWGAMAFSPDSRLLAISKSQAWVQLIDADTGNEMATLEAPEPGYGASLRFSPDGTRLAVTLGSQAVRLWDLRLMRARLKELDLDWTHPPCPPEAAASQAPLRPNN